MKVFTMTIHPGVFWVADIPYTNASATKKRPCLSYGSTAQTWLSRQSQQRLREQYMTWRSKLGNRRVWFELLLFGFRDSIVWNSVYLLLESVEFSQRMGNVSNKFGRTTSSRNSE
jgi:hypothetical protein